LRIKTHAILYIINVLTAIFFIIVTIFPNNILRIILGLPLVLLFPGYALVEAIFHRKSSMDRIERAALSFVFSVAVTIILGLILNYTVWGITVYSMLVSVAMFILITSIIAWFRQWKLPESEESIIYVDFASWSKQNLLSKTMSIILVTVTLSTIGILIYKFTKPNTSDRFTEFYILNSAGEANDYPTEITLGYAGQVDLVIINEEQKLTTYKVQIEVNGLPNGTFGPINLEPGEKSDSEISFTPTTSGEHQEVEFNLYENGQNESNLNLHLWINVH